MAQTIKLKRSATSGAIPTTSNLALGEVAINTYDGKMYIKKDVGGTESIVEIGGSGANTVSYLEAGMVEYEYTATSNQTTFSGSDSNSATLSYTANSIMVFLNGVLQDDGVDYTATNGTSVVFTSALTANDEVRIIAIDTVATTSNLSDPTKLDAITTVNAQAAYSLTLNSSAYTPSSQNALIVSLNGVTQEPGDSFTISGSTITFSPALVTGDVVDYIVDMGRAVTIGEYSGDLAVGGNLTVGGESTFSGDIIMSGFPESIYELRGDIDGGIRFTAQAGEALSKGDVVYISGAAGDNTIVSKAQANSSSTMPAFGFVLANASNGASCQIVTFGNLYGSGGAPLDTDAFNVGDTLYVSATTAGGFTSTPPTGESNLIQNIGKIIRSASSNGVIKVGGAGRTNAVPNLDDGDIFIGNASNQAVTASLNTKIEDYLDAGTSTPSFSTINSGNITTTGYIAGPSTFTIDPAAVGDNTGTLVIAGNLQVDGTTTTINSTTMTVDDLNITLASGAANAAAANGAGITVDGASATLTYNGTNDDWNFNKDLNVTGNLTSTGIDDNATSTAITIDSSENVGIGTTDPQGFRIATRYNGNMMRLRGSASEYLDFTASEPDDQLQINAVNGDLSLAVNGSEKVRVENNGNVGIGAAPTGVSSYRTLNITGPDANVGGALRLSTTDGSCGNIFNYNTTLYLYGETATLIGWGDPAVGGTKIGYRMDGSAALHRWFDPSDGTTERMRISSTGNVGIGTPAPQALFHARKSTAVAAELEVGRFETFLTGPTNAQQILKILEDNRSGGGLTPYSRFESVFIDSGGSTLDAGFEFGGNSAGSYLTIDSSGNTTISGDLTLASQDAKLIFGESGGAYGGPHGLDFYDSDGTLKWGYYYRTTPDTITWELSGTTALMTLETDGTLTVDGAIEIDDVVLGGSGTIAGATWANGTFHLGTSTAGWAMDSNELYNSGAAIIGTLASDLNLNPAGSITTSKPFSSTNTITASGGNSTNWNTAYSWGNHASAGYFTTSNDGSGSGLDADLLDGIQATGFVNQNGTYTLASGYSVAQGDWGLRNSTPYGWIQFGPANGSYAHIYTDRSNFYFNVDTLYANGNLMWHSANDGSGSGLDADTVDGVQAASMVQLAAAQTITGVKYFNGNINTTSSNPPLQAYGTTSGAIMAFHRGGYYAVNFGLDSDNVMRIGGWSAAANRWQLDMSGNMTVAGNVTAYSDIRLKENIEIIPDALNKVQQLRGVTYTRNDQEDKEKSHTGVIAQEVEAVLPEVVVEDNNGIKHVAYGNMVGLLVEAIKELKAEIEELKNGTSN